MKLYMVLDEAGSEAMDSSGYLPRSSWLADRGSISQQQLGSAFNGTQHPQLEAGAHSGVARLVWEAKYWSFEPHHEGWTLQQRILRLSPRLRAETYLAACAQWALTHPQLAALGANPRLPELAQDTLKGLAAAGPQNTADNERALLTCGERIIDLVHEGKIDKEVVPIINALRADLATVQFSEALEDEAYRLVGAIGRFMALAAKTDTMLPVDGIVLATLEGAVRTLNAMSHSEDENND